MKKTQDKVLLVKIKNIVGFLYLPHNHTNNAIIHAKGGPSLGDNGKSELWGVAKKYKQILFVPDYIGHCRSDGEFSFLSNIQTFHEAESFLRGNIKGKILGTNDTISLTCDTIILIGSSWGGSMVPFLELKKKSSITIIGLVKPVLDWKTQGKTTYKEENIEETDQLIREGFSHLYRGYTASEWPDIFKGKREDYNPLDNMHLLKDKTVYICHGKQDTSINWRKSQRYFKEFKKQYPKADITLSLGDGDHSSEFTAQAVEVILKEVNKRKK